MNARQRDSESERLAAYGRRYSIWREAMTAAAVQRQQQPKTFRSAQVRAEERRAAIARATRRWHRRREIVAWALVCLGGAAVAWLVW